jgi:hypothetical protein
LSHAAVAAVATAAAAAAAAAGQAVLVVGFLPEEYEAFRSMMLDIEADMVKVRTGYAAGKHLLDKIL